MGFFEQNRRPTVARAPRPGSDASWGTGRWFGRRARREVTARSRVSRPRRSCLRIVRPAFHLAQPHRGVARTLGSQHHGAAPSMQPPPRRALRVQRLAASKHTVYQLGRGLLVVFKPRGHVERAHAHGHAQRLILLRGTLVVQLDDRRVVLTAGSAPFVVPAGRRHATRARMDTWLLVTSNPAGPRRERATRRPSGARGAGG
jgi:quercetin dioxygenase-like cupin family protein